MAITTALSPDNTILAKRMEPNALQKMGEEKSNPKNMAFPYYKNSSATKKALSRKAPIVQAVETTLCKPDTSSLALFHVHKASLYIVSPHRVACTSC
jgi:hypothetical protein